MPQLFSPAPSLLSSWRILPKKPGVYIFKDIQKVIIYVGKAKNLHNRVGSYLKPPTQLGPKTQAMVSKAKTLETIEVTSELEALLLESRLIKKFKPFYNLISKDDKSPYYIHITQEEFPRPIINHDSTKAMAGPFLNRYIPTRILRQFRKVTPYCLSPRPVKRPCLYSHLGLCHPCPGNITTNLDKLNYKQNLIRLKKLLSGQFSAVKSSLKKEMSLFSEHQNYEQAGLVKNYLQSLELLLTIPISPDEYLQNPNLTQDLRQQSVDALAKALTISNLTRIEMYDNAHLSGTAATSAMTVAINGELKNNLYRHFSLKNPNTDSDVDMMIEVMTRRFKNLDWPLPNLIVLDGGKPQLSSVKNLIPKDIPIISLAKQFETIVIPVGDSYREVQLPKNHPGLQLLQNLRDEAHRFSRRLHHKHRKVAQFA